MEALIKVPAEQFNLGLFEKIKSLLKNEYNLEVTISIRGGGTASLLNESSEEYWKRLGNSVLQVQKGNTLLFTMEELDKYLNENFSK